MRAATLLLALVACGDNLAPPIDAQVDFLTRLRGLPGVASASEVPTATAGYHYYVARITQPVDHADPGGATFLQEVSLLHKDEAAPLFVYTTGYHDYELDYADELAQFLAGNQLSIEHRFFGTSRPDPVDWTKLTVEQMAADEHAIITAFKQLYPGKVITTGGSKGGMTAVFHRRFYPDDVDGTVAYVAPISFAERDPRYPPYLAALGTPACRAAIQAVAVELLAHRRAAMEQRAQAEATATGYAYTRVPLGPAVEAAINDLEWQFWQYHGAPFCGNIVDPADTDDKLYAYLDDISAPNANSDQSIVTFEAYYYQSDNQLGSPDDGTAYLDPYRRYTDADYARFLPGPRPAYDGGAAMRDVDDFVQHAAARLLFVYGAWDPWTGGAFQLGDAQDSLLVTVAKGSHNANLRRLAAVDQEAAFAKLAAWTGVTPTVTARVDRATPPEPHLPSALRRALHARRP